MPCLIVFQIVHIWLDIGKTTHPHSALRSQIE